MNKLQQAISDFIKQALVSSEIVNSHKGNLDDLVEIIDGVQKDISNIECKVEYINNDVSDLGSRVNDVEETREEVRSVECEMDTLKEDLDALSDRVSSTEVKLEHLNEDNHESRIVALEEAMKEVASVSDTIERTIDKCISSFFDRISSDLTDKIINTICQPVNSDRKE